MIEYLNSKVQAWSYCSSTSTSFYTRTQGCIVKCEDEYDGTYFRWGVVPMDTSEEECERIVAEGGDMLSYSMLKRMLDMFDEKGKDKR